MSRFYNFFIVFAASFGNKFQNMGQQQPLTRPLAQRAGLANIFINKAPYKKILFILSVQLLIGSVCPAQDYSELSASDTISIQSKILNAERKIIVTRSLKIKEADLDNNCILYMDADDPNVNGIFLQSANNLLANSEIPASYLIGILQMDRNRELLQKDRLLEFITKELVPQLSAKYRIANKVTIAGHSFGAYFATYAYLRDNRLYNSCIAISPAYWPNENDVLNLLDQKKNSVLGSFFLAAGDKRWDEISLRKGVVSAQKILLGQKNIRFNFHDLKGFSHNATPAPGFALGLGFVYDQWEWEGILAEQETKLKQFPGFWGHLEIKGDALFHLKRFAEAKVAYSQALANLPKDEYLTALQRRLHRKILRKKMRNCR